MIKKDDLYTCQICNFTCSTYKNNRLHFQTSTHKINVQMKLLGIRQIPSSSPQLDTYPSPKKQSIVVYCEACKKKFKSTHTYRNHLSSKKHIMNKQKANNKKNKNQASSSFPAMEELEANQQPCCLCFKQMSASHMRTQHQFPPFPEECVDFNGIFEYLREKISDCQCIYCNTKFESEKSTRQHMMDLGHTMINFDKFQEYEKFYEWKIEEEQPIRQEANKDEQIHSFYSSKNQSEQNSFFEQLQSHSQSELSSEYNSFGDLQVDENLSNTEFLEEQQTDKESSIFSELFQKSQAESNSFYHNMKNPTLNELEEMRLSRIKLESTGVVINGKMVGYRCYKNYYKQYLGRFMEQNKESKPAVQVDSENWKGLARRQLNFKKKPHQKTHLINQK